MINTLENANMQKLIPNEIMHVTSAVLGLAT